MTTPGRIELAKGIAADLRQSAIDNDWPEVGNAAEDIEAALKGHGDLTAALEAVWDLVEAENPEFGGRIRDVIDMPECAE